jgi:hypothetical protein
MPPRKKEKSKNEELELRLHSGQSQVYKDDSHIRMLCAGRRFGKTRLQVVEIVSNVLSFDRPLNELSPETVLVVMPTLVQAKRVIWTPLENIFEKIPGCIINKTDRTLAVPGKPTVIVAGAESSEGIRGLRVWKFHGDECQDFPPSFLETVVFPAMSDTEGSSSLLTFTPKGKTNWTYSFSQRDTTKLYQLETLQNPFIDRAEIERYRGILPPRVFRQEYQASFESFAGQFFTEFNPDIHILTEQMVDEFRHSGGFDRVYMGVDFGDVNPAFVVAGLAHGCLYVLEWQQLGDGSNPVPATVFMAALAKACRRWGVYRCFCDPSRPSAIMDIRTYGKLNNAPGLIRAIAGKNSIIPGISDVNSLFYQSRLFVPHSASDELLSYRRKPLRSDSEQFEDKVMDGQADHCVDSLRYLVHTINVRSKGKFVNGFESKQPFDDE